MKLRTVRAPDCGDASMHAGKTSDEPVTLIHIGRHDTRVVAVSTNGANNAITLGIGSVVTAKECFQHDPPTPPELENAITLIEDEVARVRPLIAQASRLLTTDESLSQLACIAGVAPTSEQSLRLEAVEQL